MIALLRSPGSPKRRGLKKERPPRFRGGLSIEDVRRDYWPAIVTTAAPVTSVTLLPMALLPKPTTVPPVLFRMPVPLLLNVQPSMSVAAVEPLVRPVVLLDRIDSTSV